MEQAPPTANTYLCQAIKHLRATGMSFTAADAIALAAISERDFATGCANKRAEAYESGLDSISSALEKIAEAINNMG
jgi:phage tail tape-measure protein